LIDQVMKHSWVKDEKNIAPLYIETIYKEYRQRLHNDKKAESRYRKHRLQSPIDPYDDIYLTQSH
jgi:hypothetical protein